MRQPARLHLGDDFIIEQVVADDIDDVVRALEMSPDELAAIARRARQRALDEHTADRRAAELEAALERASRPLDDPAVGRVASPMGA